MLILTFAVFALVELSPYAPPAEVGISSGEAVESSTLIERYARWLANLSPIGRHEESGLLALRAPDFGNSRATRRPAMEMIAPALRITLALNAVSLVIIYLTAIPLGIRAGIRSGSKFDKLSGGALVALWAMPTIWVSILSIGYIASERGLGLFPISGLHDADASGFRFMPTVDAGGSFQRGYLLDTIWHAALPVLCLSYAGLAILAKQTRAAVLEHLGADHVRTAVAKGVDTKGVIRRHVVRNSLLPILVLSGSLIPQLVSGSVVVEQVFSIPGMGSLVLDAVLARDTNLLLANVVIIGGVTILALLAVDLIARAVDPRTGEGPR